jgi:3-phosphoshikimate 1-carboxyvinyltransferase
MTASQITLDLRDAACGTVCLPGSKSLSNRALLLAAIARGQTELNGLLVSDDTAVMMQSLRSLGVSIDDAVDGRTLVQGVAGRFPNRGSADAPLVLFVGNSGLTIRTLLPVLVASLSLQAAGAGQPEGCVVLQGVARMHERPIGDLVEGLRAIGAQIDYLQAEGYPPLRVRAAVLPPVDRITVRASTSSQFLTGLLQAAPLFACQWGMPVTVRVDGDLISRPYIDLTCDMLGRFGVAVTEPAADPAGAAGAQFSVSPAVLALRAPHSSVALQAPAQLMVEGDASSASYFLAAGLVGGGPVRVTGVGQASRQGDIRFANALEKMGAQVVWGEDFIEVAAGRRSPDGRPLLTAIDLDCNDIPDAAMTLVPLALYADGSSRLRNIGSWRVKETDRIAAMATEARKFGAQVEEGVDFIRVHPPAQPRSAEVHTYDDHRVAMSFSLLSFRHAADPLPGGSLQKTQGTSAFSGSEHLRTVTIRDPGCVAKTFPNYFDVFADICAQAVPVIAIDGPTASGKGTVAARVAEALGFHYLDSGALYRLLALKTVQLGLPHHDEAAMASVAASLDIGFAQGEVWLGGVKVTEAIRAEAVGNRASEVAALPEVRAALLRRQRDFARAPGLVADGRDMGSVVFPRAQTKIFLTASAQSRAERRFKQLIDKGIPAKLEDLLADLQARDARDSSRAVAPLRYVEGSGVVFLDTTSKTIPQAVEAILQAYRSRRSD